MLAITDQFEKEIEGRYGVNGVPLPHRAIVPLLGWHTPAGEGYTDIITKQTEDPQYTDEADEFKYVMRMQAGERSLHSACATERMAGYDLAKVRSTFRDGLKCVRDLHDLDVVHADVS